MFSLFFCTVLLGTGGNIQFLQGVSFGIGPTKLSRGEITDAIHGPNTEAKKHGRSIK